MKASLSERARRLVAAINILWSSRRSGGGLESLLSADETETHRAAPTTETSAAAARAETPPPVDAQRRGADCPLAGCTTCEPAGPTADELEVNAVAWQLLDTLPEIWYRATPAETHAMAAALVKLRRGVESGRWEVEAVRAC